MEFDQLIMILVIGAAQLSVSLILIFGNRQEKLPRCEKHEVFDWKKQGF